MTTRYVSISEVKAFLRCRRKWNYGSPNRRMLSPKRGSSVMRLGTAIHEALHDYRLGLPWPETHTRLHKEAEDEYRAAYGMGWSPIEEQLFQDILDKAYRCVEYYKEHWGIQCPEAIFGGEVMYTEQSFAVPVPWVDGVELIGTIDVILGNEAGIWVMDHKSHRKSSFRTRQEVRVDWQFLAYAWAARQLFGDTVAGVCYDGIWQEAPPTAPPILKSGKLSTAWNRVRAIPPYRYAQMLMATPGCSPRDYSETLQKLTAAYAGDETPYHCRHWVDLGTARLSAFEKRLSSVIKDMFSGNPSIYPNPQGSCWDCSFQDLCGADMEGSADRRESLINANYQAGKEYGTLKALRSQQRKEV